MSLSPARRSISTRCTSWRISHCCYLLAFISISKAIKPLLLLVVLLWGGVVYYLIAPTLGDLKIMITIYLCVICVLVWRALAIFHEDSFGRMAAIGAVGLALSDTLLAVDYFYRAFDLAPYLVLITYLFGQYTITRSALKR